MESTWYLILATCVTGYEINNEEDKIRLHLFEKEVMESYMYETQQKLNDNLEYKVTNTVQG